MSRKQFTHFGTCRNNDLRAFGIHVAKTIYALFLSQKEFTHLFVAKTIYALFLSRKQFTHFVRKVFARKSLPTGKLRLFRSLVSGDIYAGLYQIAFIAVHTVGEYGGSRQSADLLPEAWEDPSSFSFPRLCHPHTHPDPS